MIKKNKMIFLILLTSLSTFLQTKCSDVSNVNILSEVFISVFKRARKEIITKTKTIFEKCLSPRKRSENKLNEAFDNLCSLHEKKAYLFNKIQFIDSVVKIQYINSMVSENEIELLGLAHKSITPPKKTLRIYLELDDVIHLKNKKNDLKLKNTSQKTKQTFDSLYKDKKSKKEKSHELLKRCINKSFNKNYCLMAVLDVAPDFSPNESKSQTK